MIGYKLTGLDYCSLFAEGAYSLLYTPGTTVRAVSCTLGLFFFNQLDHATDFAQHYTRDPHYVLKLLEIEYDHTVATENPLVSPAFYTEYGLDLFYNKNLSPNGQAARRQMKINGWVLSETPVGTVACHTIKVIKEVSLP